jgi:putative membrane protein
LVLPNLNVKQYLGRKTYWLFFLKNSVGAIIFLFLAMVFLILSSIGSTTLIPGLAEDGGRALQAFLILAFLITAFLFVLLAIIAAIWTYYEYKNYIFVLDDHALEVSRGVFNKENISIPYHHIEDINLEQSLFYQILGVCRVVIMTAGYGRDEDGYHNRAEGILPVIDLETAREIQKLIMQRSNFQEVVMKSKVIGPGTGVI